MIYPDDDWNPQRTTHDDQPESRLHNALDFELKVYSPKSASIVASFPVNHSNARDISAASPTKAAFSSSVDV
jgi:hypothetical protein